MNIRDKVMHGFIDMLKSDKNSIYYILFYALVEGVLILAIPLTSSFVINSLIAHSYVSLMTLGIIVSIVFALITFLRLMQEYIIEKFEQRVFVREGFEIGNKAYSFAESKKVMHYPMDKLMNYFFDITTIQKVFPVFILSGVGLIIQTILTLTLLLIFNVSLFFGALVIMVLHLSLITLFGKNGIKFAINRSDAKHNTIHFLQKIPDTKLSRDEMTSSLEEKMSEYVDARQSHFNVQIKQLGISFLSQGLMITGFFVLGGYLVIKGSMPIGEFVASEIVVVTLMYAMNSFVKQLDYIYDGIEGFYKIEKLSSSLDGTGEGESEHA